MCNRHSCYKTHSEPHAIITGLRNSSIKRSFLIPWMSVRLVCVDQLSRGFTDPILALTSAGPPLTVSPPRSQTILGTKSALLAATALSHCRQMLDLWPTSFSCAGAKLKPIHTKTVMISITISVCVNPAIHPDLLKLYFCCYSV